MTKRVLIACEESQAVTKRMRAMGIEAYSCDTRPTSGPHPEWHLQQDVLPLLAQPWAMIIAFPPCTHLAVSGSRWFAEKRADGRQQAGIDFFMEFTRTHCERVVIENPIGIMSRLYRKPDQIIQPYMFGDPFEKKTCLWLKGVPDLVPTSIVDAGERTVYASGKSIPKWFADAYALPPEERSRIRSKTFDGIADAMATQWGSLIK